MCQSCSSSEVNRNCPFRVTRTQFPQTSLTEVSKNSYERVHEVLEELGIHKLCNCSKLLMNRPAQVLAPAYYTFLNSRDEFFSCSCGSTQFEIYSGV